MKIFTLLLLTSLVVNSMAGEILNDEPIITNCSALLSFVTYIQTIFIDLGEDTDFSLKTCLLKNIQYDQAVTIIKTQEKQKDFQIDFTKPLFLTSDFPATTIVIERLSFDLIDAPFFQTLFVSHWSIVYILVTSDKRFKCDEGTMNSQDLTFLEKFMNKLWLKFRFMLVGVGFPFACQNIYAGYYGKKQSNTSLYDRGITFYDTYRPIDVIKTFMFSGKDLAEHYPIRASLFFRYPTSITTCKDTLYIRRFDRDLTYGFCGLDGMVMHDVLKYFKFNLTFSEDESCINYGYVDSGNVSGSLGCIARKELDVSFNSRFMTSYSHDNIHYLYYVTTDSLCALVKQADIIPIWIAFYNISKFSVLCFVFSLIVSLGLLMWIKALIEKMLTGRKPMSLWFYVHDATKSSILGYTLRNKKTVLRGTCLFLSILINAIFQVSVILQSHINRTYTTLQRYKNIETLQDLYSCGATLYTSPNIKELLREVIDPNDKSQVNFLNRAQMSTGMKLDFLIKNPKVTTLDRKNDIAMQILEHYKDIHGKPMINIVEECFSNYFLSYIARSDFPFFENVREFMERMQGAGLPTMYYTWTQRMLGIPEVTFKNPQEARPFAETSLDNLRISYAILFCGYFLSTMLFVVELWKGRRDRLQNENGMGPVSNRKLKKKHVRGAL
ncbi:uncharacterized protein LOC113500511 [Trichoplusia ni]|uniref:Uncharacterized protein LOC113500511 n=1 Tax=Trichoplusia ni TaxID=7111 RepID=A0A7E5W922_TRINI|nr:uncharacterized protein LOC113500511 [Trichoplusia ni]